jgi:hypothetical protein
MATTIQKGDTFRDLVASMLEASGFIAETETRERFKKVDVRWRREDLDGPVKYFVEAKDHAGTLGMDECREFLQDYGTLVDGAHADRAWLISKGQLSPDGRAMVDEKRGCKAMTFAEFQRRLLGLDSYLHDLIATYDTDGIAEWYIRPHTSDGTDLEDVVRDWIGKPDAKPLAIVAAYGKGKSTFARQLAAALAREALTEAWRRVPILVPLGDIVDEQSLEGLLGKVFTSRPGVRGYNFGLFEQLNHSGRFVVIFDGFDEMKHGMTLARFEANIVELMRLDKGAAKLIILGRDTAFHDDYEFRSIIMGRQHTAGGQEVAARDRRAFRQIQMSDFSIEEARRFVERFFPVAARDAARGSGKPADEAWITERCAELLGDSFDSLLVRPVHAQMLCQIATDRDQFLSNLSKYRLFDLFVHFLLDREVKKRGRDRRFSLDVRRHFSRALALWLWEQGGISTVTLASIPVEICRRTARGVSHDYDDDGLRKELTAGCLIEKGSTGTIFFGHRSLQEFLVAEELIQTDLGRFATTDKGAALLILSCVTPEITEFIVEAVKSSEKAREIVGDWFYLLQGTYRTMSRSCMRFFIELGTLAQIVVPKSNDPWPAWLRYFAANRSAEYAPRSRAAGEELISICKSLMRGSNQQQAAALLLIAEVLSRRSDERSRLMGPVIGAWLDPTTIREAVKAARRMGSAEHYYVPQDGNVAFWTFLYAAQIEISPPVVSIDLQEVRRRAGAVLSLGFFEDREEPATADFHMVVAPLQAIYRSWKLSEAELDRIRPYFGDPTLRAKIRPLEIVRSGGPREEQQARPTQATPLPTLSLKRRGPTKFR